MSETFDTIRSGIIGGSPEVRQMAMEAVGRVESLLEAYRRVRAEEDRRWPGSALGRKDRGGNDVDKAEEKLTAEAKPEAPAKCGFWLIHFEDNEMPMEIFTDYGAASARFYACQLNWTCHLFEMIAPQPVVKQYLTTESPAPATECACRKALKAYMFCEQTKGGLNPHAEGTNKARAFDLGRAALAAPCECAGLREELATAIYALRTGEVMVRELRAELAAANQLAKGLDLIRQNASRCVGMLEDAGMGKEGPNCLTDMTAEIVNKLAAANERLANMEENFRIEAAGCIAANERAERHLRAFSFIDKVRIEAERQRDEARAGWRECAEALRGYLAWKHPRADAAIAVARFDARGGGK